MTHHHPTVDVPFAVGAWNRWVIRGRRRRTYLPVIAAWPTVTVAGVTEQWPAALVWPLARRRWYLGTSTLYVTCEGGP